MGKADRQYICCKSRTPLSFGCWDINDDWLCSSLRQLFSALESSQQCSRGPPSTNQGDHHYLPTFLRLLEPFPSGHLSKEPDIREMLLGRPFWHGEFWVGRNGRWRGISWNQVKAGKGRWTLQLTGKRDPKALWKKGVCPWMRIEKKNSLQLEHRGWRVRLGRSLPSLGL